MITQEEVEKAIDGCSESGWGCSAQDTLRQLLKERDAYRFALADHMNGVTREDELRNADKEAAVMRRILEQRNQSKQSKNGGEND